METSKEPDELDLQIAREEKEYLAHCLAKDLRNNDFVIWESYIEHEEIVENIITFSDIQCTRKRSIKRAYA